MEQSESSHYPEKHAEDSSHNRTSEIRTELNSATPEDTNALERTTTIEHYQLDKTAVKRPTSGAIELKIPPHLSIQENGKSSIQTFRSKDVLEEQDDHKYKGAEDGSAQSNKSPCRYCTKPTSTNNVRSETKELPSNITSNLMSEPKKMDDWTKKDVYQWIINAIKIPQKYADILYNEDVSGASLMLFNKQDFLDIGFKHGPAVEILKKVAQFKASSENLKNSGIPEETGVGQVRTSTIEHYQQDKTAVNRPISGSTELEVPLSIQENRDGTPSIQRWPQASEDIPKHKGNGGESYSDTACIQKDKLKFEEHDLKDKKECGASDVQLIFPVTHKNTLCAPRPFDESSPLFEYKQNEILSPETGPSNLIDPVHEYKLLVGTENVSEKDILKKFTDKSFRFAAGCLNSRTNGTIHFGVGDEPLYSHGQIIGLELRSPKNFIDTFDMCLKEHFKGHTSTARACIRPPKFFKVKCPDNIKVDRWVIEVDVVPKYELTLEKLFYTTIDKKGRKSKCFFIRLGANTTNHIPEKDPRTVKQNMKTLKNDVKLWALSRKLAEKG
ncbi:sterile alpha motif domain-containing protein 9-like isoform X1 [Xyrauchen texanus]|uniref:sterile alpha motif domain-containing protein 9-like isoform X1 n=1 Tax=Xyrauchen texanus TaxID=154827 RepID=UPI0022418F8A|nr:sterile alpha motif domain-containing protein 9-like isoform X1 [Xyrauchen texanus]XP_051983593.1 sterile alpha motif domain-containing protein 9-like isoform X1 [Xyrauchen texanus]